MAPSDRMKDAVPRVNRLLRRKRAFLNRRQILHLGRKRVPNCRRCHHRRRQHRARTAFPANRRRRSRNRTPRSAPSRAGWRPNRRCSHRRAGPHNNSSCAQRLPRCGWPRSHRRRADIGADSRSSTSYKRPWCSKWRPTRSDGFAVVPENIAAVIEENYRARGILPDMLHGFRRWSPSQRLPPGGVA